MSSPPSRILRVQNGDHSTSSSSPITESTATTAASPFDDNLDMLKHILSFVGERQYRFIAGVNRSFKGAHVDVFPGKKVTYLNASTAELARICWNEIDQGVDDHQRALCKSAAKHGNLPSLQYLFSVNCQRDRRTCGAAAGSGRLNVLQWCRENGCPWDEDTCANAAANGHFNVLQLCRENGCPGDSWTCINAAKNGHLNVLQWCRENGCPWDSWTCSNAAENGHLNVWQWCRENGCPCKRSTVVTWNSRRMNVVDWCQANGIPFHDAGIDEDESD